MAESLAVAVDIGATRMRVCVGDAPGRILWRLERVATYPEKVDGYVDQVTRLVGSAIRQVPRGRKIKGIGVASIGPLDIERGCMARPANIPYGSVPLVKPIEDEHEYPVSLINDANAAALAEHRFGAGKGIDNLVYVTLSTGIGGGAIVDGHLLIGKDGNAAEIGHVVVDSAERLTCGCGRRGHWEAYCSGKNLPRFVSLLAKEAHLRKGEPAWPPTAAWVFRAARRGNRFARRAVAEIGRLNAMGVANAVNVFDPSLVTLGGGVVLNNQEQILRPIRSRLARFAMNRLPDVMISPLGDDAGLLGALCVAFGAPRK